MKLQLLAQRHSRCCELRVTDSPASACVLWELKRVPLLGGCDGRMISGGKSLSHCQTAC